MDSLSAREDVAYQWVATLAVFATIRETSEAKFKETIEAETTLDSFVVLEVTE